MGVCVCVSACTHVFGYVCICVCDCKCVYLYMCVEVHVCEGAYVSSCAHVCTGVRVICLYVWYICGMCFHDMWARLVCAWYVWVYVYPDWVWICRGQVGCGSGSNPSGPSLLATLLAQCLFLVTAGHPWAVYLCQVPEAQPTALSPWWGTFLPLPRFCCRMSHSLSFSSSLSQKENLQNLLVSGFQGESPWGLVNYLVEKGGVFMMGLRLEEWPRNNRNGHFRKHQSSSRF